MGEIVSKNHSPQCIQLRGGRMHNLQHIDLDIPLWKLVVVCGVSGSGKTSLALDTLFAEGQRRYIESFAPQLRQFLPRPDKPDYDRLDNLPASIAIKRRFSKNDRATVATTSEIDDYLRILFAGVARLYCPECQQPIVRHDPSKVAEWLASQPKARAMIAFAFDWTDVTDISMQLADFQQSGFTRIIVGNKTWNVDSDDRKQLAQSASTHQHGFVIVDRVLTSENSPRIHESLETAFSWGNDQVTVFIENTGDVPRDYSGSDCQKKLVQVDNRSFLQYDFSRELTCRSCNQTFPTPEPNTFQFNSPLGKCSECDGLGSTKKPTDLVGVVCRECNGSRLNRFANAFRIEQRSIAAVRAMTVEELSLWLSDLKLEANANQSYDDCFREIRARLQYLSQVGLSYLQLDRSLPTLSTGEVARVQLTNLLGSSLVNMLYVLDEPTAGLHPSETNLLAEAIENLCRRNNSVILVEHDPLLMRRADWIIEVGPDAGEAGGQICSHGPMPDWLHSSSPTACRLRHESGTESNGSNVKLKTTATAKRLGGDEQSLEKASKQLFLSGANGRNLKSIDVKLPLNQFCVVTGVSGSGKSSLVLDTLVPAIQRALGANANPLGYKTLAGHEHISGIECIDASPVSQSKRSNPASFTKIFDDIRKLYATTPDASRLGWTASHFSFNSPHGECSRCNGDGQLVIDMQFMSDIETECPECRGSGYRSEVLSVKYRDRSIDECLSMSVAEGKQFFRGQTKIQKKLGRMIDLGLGYLALGQRLSTLSSGELQRLKLANCLMDSKRSMLFVMDEPTTGLHFSDIDRLIKLIRELIREGHSVLAVEHNTQLIESADHVIDLGPGAGENGGQIVATGTPNEIAKNPSSLTGKHLFVQDPY
jgi:excinuclease ABC subunit A